MTKTMNIGDIRPILDDLLGNWMRERNKIVLSVPSMYALIGLKKTLEDKASQIQETITTLAEQAGGTPQQDGTYHIPDDQVMNLNKQLMEVNAQKIDIEYTPIKISKEDSIPPVILDAIYDFVEIES